MNRESEVAVTLPAVVYTKLRAEAKRLGVPVEWVIAGLIVDSMEAAEQITSAA